MVILHKLIQLLNVLFFQIPTDIITAITAVRTSAAGNITRISPEPVHIKQVCRLNESPAQSAPFNKPPHKSDLRGGIFILF